MQNKGFGVQEMSGQSLAVLITSCVTLGVANVAASASSGV